MSNNTHVSHSTDPGRPITVVQGLEYSICFCLVALIRQIPPAMSGILSLPIPRDWDLARVEALADMESYFDSTESAAHLGRIADRAARWAFFRDLDALRGFYVDNPEFPLPWAATFNAHVDAGTLKTIADKYADGRMYPPGLMDQTDFDLPGATTRIGFIVSIDKSATRGPL